MAQRVGLRLNPTAGSCELVLPLDVDEYVRGLRLFTDTSDHHFLYADLLDLGGGTYNYHDVNFTPVLGLKKTVTASLPWTIWFSVPENGVYTSLMAGTYSLSAVDDIRARLILETDGVESVLYNQTSFNFDLSGSYSGNDWSGAISMTIAEPVVYSNFWTDFNKTQENAPS